MPGFSTWGNASFHSAPLTPPDYDHGYQSRIYNPSWSSKPSLTQSSLPKFNDNSKRMSAFNPHQYSNRHSTALLPPPAPDFDHVPYQQPTYSNRAMNIGAPILPPIRSQDVAIDPYAHYMASSQPAAEPKAKEEKATGGVAAHLDYDMQTMTDFVTEKSKAMYEVYQSGVRLTDIDFIGTIGATTHVEAQYRKYVSQILSSTRLPSSTIMLGLFYLSSRFKILSTRGRAFHSRDAIYRMLTTCLLLGSKFLDDNTFQNRSWAEVSQINVKDLNKMELDWLMDFEWCIHGRMYDCQEGFHTWRNLWLRYEDDVKARKLRDAAAKISPINTSLPRQPLMLTPIMSPEGPIPDQYQQRPIHLEPQWVSPLVSEPSPPSLAYSGSSTPEYYDSTNWSYLPPAYSAQAWSSTSAHTTFPAPRSHHAQHYLQPISNVWPMSGCACTMYTKCRDHYYMQSHHYGMQQTVAC